MIEWMERDRFKVGDTTFQGMPPDFFEGGALSVEESDFFVFKFRSEIEEYARLFGRLRPERIFELGIHGGGSAVLFAELSSPTKLVTIDIEPLVDVRGQIDAYAADKGIDRAISAFGGINQGNRDELARIAEREFGHAPLDLVIDDCSHLYAPTRASFNELFPRLRTGGVYVIEDWRWGHTPMDQDTAAGWVPDIPLSRLVTEITLASARLPGLISEILIRSNGVRIVRGEASLRDIAFDVSELAQSGSGTREE